ncbi:uncharacterized protein LOC126829337 [Patella vulgata]|uniref:uncharacterized protein LOC126829337 n=1 Tax=Patella vulgata TaxID=6465 RepID=UPI002180306D|nr:uncharacterized protein LOC126829337 [Patella vulgata]
MADKMNESWLDIDDVDENQVIRLQAHIRGVLTRKWMKKLRQDFEELCNNIERKPLEIEWPSNNICSPRIRNTKQRKNKNASKETSSKNIVSCSDKNIVSCSENTEKLSVEIQTDFDTCGSPFLHVHQQNMDSSERTGSEKHFENQTNNRGSEQNLNKAKISTSEDRKFLPESSVNNRNTHFDPNRHFEQIDNGTGTYSGYHDVDVIPQKDSPDKQVELTDLKTVEGRDVDLSTQEQSVRRGGLDNSVNDDTSVWDPDNSSFQSHTDVKKLTTDKKDLAELRKNLAMELLWIQQAIQSRKNYLKLKDEMT